MKTIAQPWFILALFFYLFTGHSGQASAGAGPENPVVTGKADRGSFPLIADGKPATLVVSGEDYPGVLRALHDLKEDFGRVCGCEPNICQDTLPSEPYLVIAGTLGRSALIDRLVAKGKLDGTLIRGKWESTLTVVVKRPFPGVKKALVIAGSDKRGTIYGLYGLSSAMGVSPWHFWADVPVVKRTELWVSKGPCLTGEPGVKYRGLFINDEAPALSGWAEEKFGGFNHLFYGHVFELILRLRGNFLWPAMWGRAFYDDDPMNPQWADTFGVVIGTSHHEPMMRAHDEWRRFGAGKWNYDANPEELQSFWTEGIRRMGDFESLVTVGMRGDGDEPMSESANIVLLEKIIADQRQILEKVTGKKAGEIPQVWALYKEVQDYYDNGMQVPGDVTLLLCDDNWGNVRKLPLPGATERKGGYGMYYHFDYVGGPRNYKWLNTNPIARVWEQMNLSFRHGVDRIWIVNVGDIKPMEFPISFFLEMAWDPEAMTPERMAGYSRKWSEQQFGPAYAGEIARMIDGYTRFNGRCKPEMLSPMTYSLHHYREFELVRDAYNQLAEDAGKLNNLLPPEYRDAFFQLVLFPVAACANLNDLYYTVALNRLYVNQGRAAANLMAGRAEELFEKDSLLSREYHQLAGGKWNHLMDQTHIGYTYWQQPPFQKMPRVGRMAVPERGSLGVACEGSADWWPNSSSEAVLPVADGFSRQQPYIELFNTGSLPVGFTVTTGASWLKVSAEKGTVPLQTRIFLQPDWASVPPGEHRVPVTITGSCGTRVEVVAPFLNPDHKSFPGIQGYLESNGVISVEAAGFNRKTEAEGITWAEIPDLGKTLSGMTVFPVTGAAANPGEKGSCLEYDLWFFAAGEVKIVAYFSPTLNFHGRGLRYGISLDDQEPQIIDIHGNTTLRMWEKWVGDNIILSESKHQVTGPGHHTLKFWYVDPGVVLQKIVADTGGLKPSYLGPPQSYYADPGKQPSP